MTTDAVPDSRPDTAPHGRPDGPPRGRPDGRPIGSPPSFLPVEPPIGGSAHGPDTSRISAPARQVLFTAVGPDPLVVDTHTAAVAGTSSGAVVSFSGVVRNHDGGRPVTSIEYVAHPTAAAVLAKVVAEVTAASEAEAVAVSHRVGPLGVGDAALVVAVAGVHRAEAFATAMLLVDEVKRQLPVWKRQIFPDGTDEWVACP